MSGPPPTHLVYRGLWSLLHGALLLLGAVLVARWWFDGSQGADLVVAWWEWARGRQQEMSGSVTFPWDHLP